MKLNRVEVPQDTVGGQDGVPVLCADFFIFLTPCPSLFCPACLLPCLDLSPQCENAFAVRKVKC